MPMFVSQARAFGYASVALRRGGTMEFPILLMDELDGTLRKKKYRDLEALALDAFATACALATLHGVGVVHGDMKPSNVLVMLDWTTSGEWPLLADYCGTCKLGEWPWRPRPLGPGQSVRLTQHTPDYTDPDVLADTPNKNRVTPQHDMYSYAVTFAGELMPADASGSLRTFFEEIRNAPAHLRPRSFLDIAASLIDMMPRKGRLVQYIDDFELVARGDGCDDVASFGAALYLLRKRMARRDAVADVCFMLAMSCKKAQRADEARAALGECLAVMPAKWTACHPKRAAAERELRELASTAAPSRSIAGLHRPLGEETLNSMAMVISTQLTDRTRFFVPFEAARDALQYMSSMDMTRVCRDAHRVHIQLPQPCNVRFVVSIHFNTLPRVESAKRGNPEGQGCAARVAVHDVVVDGVSCPTAFSEIDVEVKLFAVDRSLIPNELLMRVGRRDTTMSLKQRLRAALKRGAGDVVLLHKGEEMQDARRIVDFLGAKANGMKVFFRLSERRAPAASPAASPGASPAASPATSPTASDDSLEVRLVARLLMDGELRVRASRVSAALILIQRLQDAVGSKPPSNFTLIHRGKEIIGNMRLADISNLENGDVVYFIPRPDPETTSWSELISRVRAEARDELMDQARPRAGPKAKPQARPRAGPKAKPQVETHTHEVFAVDVDTEDLLATLRRHVQRDELVEIVSKVVGAMRHSKGQIAVCGDMEVLKHGVAERRAALVELADQAKRRGVTLVDKVWAPKSKYFIHDACQVTRREAQCALDIVANLARFRVDAVAVVGGDRCLVIYVKPGWAPSDMGCLRA
jgi:hypothetical protein